MILLSGPYHGRIIEDTGTVVMNMCIYDPIEAVGSLCGEARYEPSPDRTMAFWEGNTWHGPLLAIVP